MAAAARHGTGIVASVIVGVAAATIVVVVDVDGKVMTLGVGTDVGVGGIWREGGLIWWFGCFGRGGKEVRGEGRTKKRRQSA
jgi:hypothetical protein